MLLPALCRHGASFGHGAHFILGIRAWKIKRLHEAAARPLRLVKSLCQFGPVQIYEKNKSHRIHKWSAGSFQHVVKELWSLQSTICSSLSFEQHIGPKK